jgi:hypothetical protein
MQFGSTSRPTPIAYEYLDITENLLPKSKLGLPTKCVTQSLVRFNLQRHIDRFYSSMSRGLPSDAANSRRV